MRKVRGLFLFHRDLRLHDNTALIKAITECDEVALAFIFPPEQIDPAKNPYFSNGAVQFMCESLVELYDQTGNTLAFYKGDNVATLQHIYAKFPFTALYQNEDYSVYARKRDDLIAKWCAEKGVEYKTTEDYGLFPLREGLVPDPKEERPYTVLAQFYKRYLKDLQVRRPQKIVANKFQKLEGNLGVRDIHKFYKPNPHIAERGGRSHGLEIIRRLRNFETYANTRDYPADDTSTTRVSAHLKFGTISIREFYWGCVKAFATRDHPLIRELIFREFYMKIYALRPELQRNHAYLPKIDGNIKWSYDKTAFNAWKTGTTGFPMADAGMRQLMALNWCHNRVRMLVASVATKYLLLDWRDCAQYFYTQLVDADTFSNTAGWGWASSTGVDAVPYFRAPFNPFIQSKKFDPDAKYIKKWIPELRDVSAKDIHKWFDPNVRAKYPDIQYPAPIIDHKEASARALKTFKAAVQ